MKSKTEKAPKRRSAEDIRQRQKSDSDGFLTANPHLAARIKTGSK